nr:putative ribonuclease H-like domain-containing protein [Tanacetum cinerariifolium]
MLADSLLPTIFCKAYRVYNLVSRKIEETINLNFLKNKPFVAGTGQAWMFDIDYLTDSLIYSRVSSTNLTTGSQGATPSNAGSQTDDSDSDDEPKVLIIQSSPSPMVPIVDEATTQNDDIKFDLAQLNADNLDELAELQALQNSCVFAESTPSVSAGSTPQMSPCASSISAGRPTGSAGRPVSAGRPTGSAGRPVSAGRPTGSAGRPVSAGRPSDSADRSSVPAGHILGQSNASTSSERFSHASSMNKSDIHDGLTIFDCPKSGIFTSSSYDEDFSGPDANNLKSFLNVSSTITKQIHNIHPTSQVIGDINSTVHTRSQVKHKGSSESAFISYIHDQRRNNHPDFQLCMFSCFLSQEEPTTMAQDLADPDWVEAMQVEMQQFKNQKVWVLVPLPDGKRAIGTKWILKNKKDARGIVCRNKARLVAQDHRQEEGIDYTDSAFLYEKIAEEVYVTQPRGFGDPDHPKRVYKNFRHFKSKNKQERRKLIALDWHFLALIQYWVLVLPPLVLLFLLESGIFTSSSYDEDFSGPDANNLESSLNVSSTITKRIHNIHPISQVIGDINSPVHTRSQALADPNWVEAMQAQMQQFRNQKVWVLVPLPDGKRAIGTKWILKNERDARGIVCRNKARQEEWIDYTDVFAPVARIKAIRLFLAFASFIGFKVYQMDVNSAFLYGKIAEEVYVTQPRGFEDPDHPKRVYKAVKALYGLHQAPRAWYERLSTFLLKHGYRRWSIDQTLFIIKDSNDIMLVQVYVDDIIFGSTRKDWCEEFETLMQSEFEMSFMGPLTFFIGLQVDQGPDGIFIHQEKYVADILKKFDLDNSKLASTPFEPQKIREKNVPDEPISVHLYRSMIGCLMYLTATRPDIMFVVCAAARHQVTPKTSNLLSVKRIFKYLTAYSKLGLWYPRDSSFDLEAFSDSDYAGAHGDRKSTTGGCQFLGRRLISWQCKKQTIVATSSCEAEYMVAASCCGQWLLVTSAGHVIFCWLIVIPAGDLVLWLQFTSAGRVILCWLIVIPAGDLVHAVVSAGHKSFLLVVSFPAGLEATIDGTSYTVTEASIRSALQLDDLNTIDTLTNAEIFYGLRAI